MSSSHPEGWCGKGDRPRQFPRREPMICYDSAPATLVDQSAYAQKRVDALSGKCVQKFEIPPKSARTWTMKKGEMCRISVVEASQVGDLNMWNLENTKERFYSGKTRQLHRSHLSVYDRLWSNLPYLRPMATIVEDSLSAYGIDEDGGSLHDVIGTRCDDYTYKLITGLDRANSCHTHLTNAVREVGLTEDDVHDVWNLFMCTGFTRDTGKYFCKASPARKGDYIGFIAEMDLRVALCACPHGDVSVTVGQPVPDEICHPLGVEVFSPEK